LLGGSCHWRERTSGRDRGPYRRAGARWAGQGMRKSIGTRISERADALPSAGRQGELQGVVVKL
jgi:hypothetical protein